MSTYKTREEYIHYISTKSWIPRVEERIIENSGDIGGADPDLYVDLLTNKIVNLSELIDLSDEELEGLNMLADKDEKCNPNPICVSIKNKLKAAGYGIYVGGKVISRPPTAVQQLRDAMAKRENIDRFDPAQREAKTIPIPENILVPSKSKQEAINIDDTFNRYKDRVNQLISAADRGNQPVCIGLLNGTTTCAGTKGFKEIKLKSLPNVTFVYLAGKYDDKAMQGLAERYEKAYKEESSVKKPVSKPSSKPASKSTTAQRTVGENPAPLRVTQPKLATPAIASSTTRKPVGSTSKSIQELTLFIKQNEQARQASATQSLLSSVHSAKVAPNVAPSTKQVQSKPKATVSLPISIKGKQHAEEEEEEQGEVGEEEAEEAEEGGGEVEEQQQEEEGEEQGEGSAEQED